MVELNHPEVKKLAGEIISYTGETMTQAVVNALRKRLLRERKKYRPQPPSLQEELLRIGQECAALPILDRRTPDEILGYNDPRLFKGNDFSQTDILSSCQLESVDWDLNSSRKGSAYHWFGYGYARSADPFLEELGRRDLMLIWV